MPWCPDSLLENRGNKRVRNILSLKSREEFRAWLEENGKRESECYVEAKRGKPVDDSQLWYLDAVEEALCFGWIDSTYSRIDGTLYQRFSPRRNNSQWTELNKERVRRLERLGLMREEGRAVLPDISPESFVPDEEIIEKLKAEGIWESFTSFPPLYQRVRLYNLMFYKRKKMNKEYSSAFSRLIDKTRKGEMYGEWNDYGRLV